MNTALKDLAIEQRRVDTTCSCCGYYIETVYQFTEHKEGLVTGLYFCCPACSNGLYIPDAKELAKFYKHQESKHLMPDEEILGMVDDFKKFMSNYVQRYGFEREDGLEYLGHAFDSWYHQQDWKYRNDKAWDLAKAAVKKTGFTH